MICIKTTKVLLHKLEYYNQYLNEKSIAHICNTMHEQLKRSTDPRLITDRILRILTIGVQDEGHTFAFSCLPVLQDGDPAEMVGE